LLEGLYDNAVVAAGFSGTINETVFFNTYKFLNGLSIVPIDKLLPVGIILPPTYISFPTCNCCEIPTSPPTSNLCPGKLLLIPTFPYMYVFPITYI
jgi:hypothetical protein